MAYSKYLNDPLDESYLIEPGEYVEEGAFPDEILYVVPDEKTIHGRHDSVLIPAGTDFLLFSSEEERKTYFYK